jgi:hypothetical protein
MPVSFSSAYAYGFALGAASSFSGSIRGVSTGKFSDKR